MKIVIDIPDVQYEYLAKIAIAGEEPLGYFERVIMRGTPLPKHHGRLIDADDIRVIELEDSLHIIRHEKGDEIDVYIDAPTIIDGSDTDE